MFISAVSVMTALGFSASLETLLIKLKKGDLGSLFNVLQSSLGILLGRRSAGNSELISGSNSFINGTLSVSNSINIEENLSIAGNLVINSDTANITHTGIGNLTVYSSLGSVEIEEVVINGKDLSNVGTISAQNLNLDNTFTINDLLATTVKSTSTLSVGGTTTLNSTVNINGTTNIDGALSMGSVLYFSNGSDITNSDLGVLNINELLTTFSGDIKINGNDITFGFGATITNNDLDTLTITESDLVAVKKVMEK